MLRIDAAAWRVAFFSSYLKWIILVGSGLAAFLFWNEKSHGITYWVIDSAKLAFWSQVIVSIVCLGWAAWQARSDRQVAVEELSRSFTTSQASQWLLSWSCVCAWGIIGYCAAVSVSLATAWPDAAWGYPELGPILQGCSVVVLATVVGYCLGRLVPSFLLIPVWVVGWFVIDAILSLQTSSLVWASTRASVDVTDRSLFREMVPSFIDFKQSGWFIAISFLLLSLLVVWAERTRFSVLLCAVAVIAAIISGTILFRVPGTVPYQSGKPKQFAPECRESDIVVVCLHPAEAPMIDDVTQKLSNMLRPVADQRIKFVDSAVYTGDSNAVPIYISDPDQLSFNLQEGLVAAVFPNAVSDGVPRLTLAQCIIATWLYSLGGYEYDTAMFWQYAYGAGSGGGPQMASETILPAVQEFAALPPDEQSRWLSENLPSVRDGTLRWTRLHD